MNEEQIKAMGSEMPYKVECDPENGELWAVLGPDGEPIEFFEDDKGGADSLADMLNAVHAAGAASAREDARVLAREVEWLRKLRLPEQPTHGKDLVYPGSEKNPARCPHLACNILAARSATDAAGALGRNGGGEPSQGETWKT